MTLEFLQPASGAADPVPCGRGLPPRYPRLLADESREVETDVLGCGDEAAANAWTIDRADEILGMRGMDAGPLRLARHVEGFTALIVSISMRYKIHAGVRVTRLFEQAPPGREG